MANNPITASGAVPLGFSIIAATSTLALTATASGSANSAGFMGAFSLLNTDGNAHVLTLLKNNGAVQGKATFGGGKHGSLRMIAYNNLWYVIWASPDITITGV